MKLLLCKGVAVGFSSSIKGGAEVPAWAPMVAEIPQLSTVPVLQVPVGGLGEWDPFCHGGGTGQATGDTGSAGREHSCLAAWVRAECERQERASLH